MKTRPDVKPASAGPDWLSGFRLALAMGDRASQIWTMVKHGGKSLRATGAEFQISGERVRQLVSQAEAILSSWPKALPWMATMPDSIREWCLFHAIESPESLAHVVLHERPSSWSKGDMQKATEWLRQQLPQLAEPDPILDATRMIEAATRSLSRARVSLEAAKRDRR